MITIKPFRAVAVDGVTLNRPNVGTAACWQGCMDNSAPPPPNYGQVTQKTLQAQIAEAPQMYQAEAQYEPLLAKLASDNQLSALNNMLLGNGKDAGLIDLTNEANSGARASLISDVASLGPSAQQAMLTANPQSAALLAKLNQQANEGLDAGNGLTPDQERAMQQASRAAYAARGLSGDNSSIMDEMVRQFALGNQLQQQRQGFAESVLGEDQQFNPLALLGINSSAINNAQGSTAGAGFNLFNPQAGLGLAQSNYATNAAFNASQPNGLQIMSALGSTVSGMMGGAGSVMGGAGSI